MKSILLETKLNSLQEEKNHSKRSSDMKVMAKTRLCCLQPIEPG